MSTYYLTHTRLTYILLALLLLPAIGRAQGGCGMTAPAPAEPGTAFLGTSSAPRAIESRPGAHLPTVGTIRALVVFAQSKEDKVESTAWPLGDFPVWADQILHELHDYYYESSNHMLDIAFDIYPEYYVGKWTETEYLNNGKKYGDFMKDMLGDLDKAMNFNAYDSWQTLDRPFRPVPGTDGSVDLLMVFHRSVGNPGWMPWTGVSDLMFEGSYYVDGNTRWFYGGTGYNNDASSSGLIVAGYPGYGAVLGYDNALTIAIHEMQHKLFSDVHSADSFAGLGVMSSNAAGMAMCAIERHFMEYIQIPMLEYNADTVITLRDYVTTDDAITIPVEQNNRYYYVLEYRAKKSKYDTAPEKGVFVYRLYDNSLKMEKRIDVMTSDGQWDWRIDDSTGAVVHAAPNALGGFNPLQKIVIDGKPYYHANYRGYEGIAFTPERSPIGMYRNPTADFILRDDTIRTNLTVTVLDMNDDEARIAITHIPPKVVGTEHIADNGFTLGTGYPNPAVASGTPVTVPYTLERSADVTITVFTMLGQVVFERTHHRAAPGQNAFLIPTTGLAPGSYTYRLQTAGKSAHKRLIITH